LKSKFGKLKNEALKDEKAAPKMYKKLLKAAKTKKDKNTIKGIIKQERHHHKLVKELKGVK
jgi:rubrerythrin